jgi:hypothetical protein
MHSLDALRFVAAASFLVLAGYVAAGSATAAPRPADSQRVVTAAKYATLQAAIDDLAAAVRAGDFRRMERILGPGSRKLIRSGDDVTDARARARFTSAYAAGASVELEGDDQATLLIGEAHWPFPVPLRRTAGGWSFDAASGAREWLDRRIGRNELSAIEVCRAYVDAQREYAAVAASDTGVRQYARKFASAPGSRDGLYWATPDGVPPSPLGPLVARARAEGYDKQPYHGYFYRILIAQGDHAPGGAYDYMVKGRMLGGFALVAYPAQWRGSGVMTFIVSHDGIVYEKNLGPRTASIARAMTRFDPDASWTAVQP